MPVLRSCDGERYSAKAIVAKGKLNAIGSGVPTNLGGTLTRRISESGRFAKRDSLFDDSWSVRPR